MDETYNNDNDIDVFDDDVFLDLSEKELRRQSNEEKAQYTPNFNRGYGFYQCFQNMRNGFMVSLDDFTRHPILGIRNGIISLFRLVGDIARTIIYGHPEPFNYQIERNKAQKAEEIKDASKEVNKNPKEEDSQSHEREEQEAKDEARNTPEKGEALLDESPVNSYLPKEGVPSFIGEEQRQYDKYMQNIKNDGKLDSVPVAFRTYELCLEAISKNPSSIKDVPLNLRDYKLCNSAVIRDGLSLKHVSPGALVSEKQYVSICNRAIKQNGLALQYMPVTMRNEKACNTATKVSPLALEFVPPELKDDNMMEESVKRDPRSLMFTTVPFMNAHYELCKSAVERNPYMLEFIPDSMKTNNPELCHTVVSRVPFVLEFVPDEIKETNPDMCINAVNKCGIALAYVPEPVKTQEMCTTAVKRNAHAIAYVPEKMRSSDMYKCAIDANIAELKDVPYKKRGYEICKDEVERDPTNIRYTPAAVQRSHVDLCSETVNKMPVTLKYIKSDILEKHPEICITAVEKSSSVFEYVPDKLAQTNPEIFSDSISKDPASVLCIRKEAITILEQQHPNILMSVAFDIIDYNKSISGDEQTIDISNIFPPSILQNEEILDALEEIKEEEAPTEQEERVDDTPGKDEVEDELDEMNTMDIQDFNDFDGDPTCNDETSESEADDATISYVMDDLDEIELS